MGTASLTFPQKMWCTHRCAVGAPKQLRFVATTLKLKKTLGPRALRMTAIAVEYTNGSNAERKVRRI